MDRERFRALVAAALDALPEEFRARIQNVAVVVENFPAEIGPPESVPENQDLLMGIYEGTPLTERSSQHVADGPDRVVLYQRNIEAVCETDDEIREEVRLTVLHELGHYFGLEEDDLADV
jgi:predicted Zn-dependent protease with MMP-like domain